MKLLKNLGKGALWVMAVAWAFGIYGPWRNRRELEFQLEHCGICLVDDQARLRLLLGPPRSDVVLGPLMFYSGDGFGDYFDSARLHARLIDYAAKEYNTLKDLTISQLAVGDDFGQPSGSVALGTGVRLFTFEIVDVRSNWPRRYFKNKVSFVERDGIAPSVTYVGCKDVDGFHCW